jgi:TIR domain
MPKKLKAFISYAHKDEAIKNDIDDHLFALKQSELIEVWQDRQIMPGDEWDELILSELRTADIIILLISVSFLNSKYIWEKELAIAMERHNNKTARIIPIMASSCDFTGMPFAGIQALPKNATPIDTFPVGGERAKVNTEIAKSIHEVVNFMSGNNPRS